MQFRNNINRVEQKCVKEYTVQLVLSPCNAYLYHGIWYVHGIPFHRRHDVKKLEILNQCYSQPHRIAPGSQLRPGITSLGRSLSVNKDDTWMGL